MVHPISIALDRIVGKKAVACNSECEYWKFPHLETACVLSDVFSVCKGQPCFVFKAKKGEYNANQFEHKNQRRPQNTNRRRCIQNVCQRKDDKICKWKQDI